MLETHLAGAEQSAFLFLGNEPQVRHCEFPEAVIDTPAQPATIFSKSERLVSTAAK